ncbi:MAG TPA: PspC domain-containing protein [Patescibacteria group bacterium]|nr:PspC domain-containing protein [Patescibacteria group bacterium]
MLFRSMANDLKALVKRGKRELVQFRLLDGPGWLGGVCAAVAYRLGLPTWLVRLAWGALALFYGTGVLLYLLLWFFVPNAPRTPADYTRRTGDDP